MNNFKSKKGAIRNVSIIRECATVSAAITGVLVVWSIVYFNMMETFNTKWVSIPFATLSVGLVLFVVDWGLRKNLPYGLDLVFSGQAFEDWRIGVFTFLLLGLCLMQAFGSMKLSWSGRKDMVQAVMEGPEIIDLGALKKDVDESTNKKLSFLEQEIKDLKNKIEQKEKEIDNNHPAFLEKIKKGEDKWGWYAGQLESKKTKATKSWNKELQEKRELFNKTLEKETAVAYSTIQTTSEFNSKSMNQFEISANRNMQYLGYFGAGSTIIVILTSIMLSLIGQSDTEAMELGKNNGVFSNVSRRKNNAAPHEIEKPVLLRSAEENIVLRNLYAKVNDLESQIENQQSASTIPVNKKSVDRSTKKVLTDQQTKNTPNPVDNKVSNKINNIEKTVDDQQKTEHKIEIKIVDGEPVVEHVDRQTKQTKLLTLSKVKSNITTYKGRLKSARKKANQKSIRTNQISLALYQEYERQLLLKKKEIS